MNIGWLKDFIALAETANFTRAAERRNASQPAFSRRIMALEAWLNVPLVDRSVFPIRLTTEGETFRDRAADILNRVSEACGAVSGFSSSGSDLVRIALPHALATGCLGAWSPQWAAAAGTRHKITTGRMHDIITEFVVDGADILIAFHSEKQSLHLDDDTYDHIVIGHERLRPYASSALAGTGMARWPGTAARPVSLLMYSPDTYLSSAVNMILEGAPTPLHGATVVESDMPDVLRALALAGQGYAFLPDCTARTAGGGLAPVGDDRWTYPLSIVAFKSRGNKRAATQRLWAHLKSGHDESVVPQRRSLRVCDLVGETPPLQDDKVRVMLR